MTRTWYLTLLAAGALAILGGSYSVYAPVRTSSDAPAVSRQSTPPLAIGGKAPGRLYPGGPAVRVPVSLTNSTDEPITVARLTTAVQTSGLPAGCSGEWFRIVQSNISTTSELRVPANATVTLPAGDASAPSIELTESQTNQDACQGAQLTLGYSASSQSDPVQAASPLLTWARPDAIEYGTRLSDQQLQATTSAPGRFVYDPAEGSVLDAGRHTLSAGFRPRDTTAHARATITTTLVVEKAAPAITWAPPRPISVGTSLSSAQLDATADVPGAFTYSPDSGTDLHAGSHVLEATFTPADASNYDVRTARVNLVVRQAHPTVSWEPSSPVTYPAELSAEQLNAEASVPGSFVYDPPLHSVPKAGRTTLSATFSPSDATDYPSTRTTAELTVAKAVPTVTWKTPAPLEAGAKLSSAQLNATASVPGAFVYSPEAGSVPLPGNQRLSASFTPTDGANYESAKADVTLAVSAKATVPAGDLLAIDIDGKPGIKVDEGFAQVSGKGLMPRSVATVYARSTPQKLGSARVGPGGILSLRAPLPAGLAPGGHHIEVRGIAASGATLVKQLPFTVASGDRLGSIGRIPKGPFATLVAFEPEEHLATMLAIMVGGFASLGALGAALGGGGARSAGSPAGAGAVAGGGSDDAFLEDVEVDRETMAKDGRGRGDRSKSWWWFYTRHVDRFSVEYPTRLAALSPVIGRVSVDGDYLRAMFGGLYVLLYPLAIGLGIAAAASTGGEALPPAFAWFVAILALSLFDAMVGYIAGLSFVTAVIVAGGMTGSASIRELSGILLVWFAVTLAAGALRPIRRHLHLTLTGLWDRAADFAIAGLFGGWLAANMVEALSPLAGFELPLAEQKWTIALVVIGLVGIRQAVETIAAHQYPDRLLAVRHRGDLESGNVQVAIGLVAQIAVYIFISAAFMKLDWPLFVGTAVFFSVLVPWLFADKLPKSAFVAKWMPAGIAKWAFVIIAGILLSMLLERVIHDPGQAQAYAFILLPLPILLCWGLELFAKEDDEDEAEVSLTSGDTDADTPAQEEGRFPMTWPLRLAGTPVLGLCVYLILSG